MILRCVGKYQTLDAIACDRRWHPEEHEKCEKVKKSKKELKKVKKVKKSKKELWKVNFEVMKMRERSSEEEGRKWREETSEDDENDDGWDAAVCRGDNMWSKDELRHKQSAK